MSTENNDQDLSELSDEDFMQMPPPVVEEEEVVEESADVDQTTEQDEEVSDTEDNGEDTSEDNQEGDQDEKEVSEEDEKETSDESEDETQDGEKSDKTDDGVSPGDNSSEPGDSQGADESVKDEKKPEGKSDNKKTDKTEKKSVDTSAAEIFMAEILKPFKADGKEISVRNSADAIRLMQMGANYSRKMAELKPAKAAQAMLEANNLDTDTLNFLIDVNKGDKGAIQKLLKEHNIDPIDFDKDATNSYTAKDYRPDMKGMDFKEAIDSTIKEDGGRELITDINASWDDESKEQLREDPSLLSNLLDEHNSGVYEKVKAERDYQIRMGYLPADVSFFEGYQAVERAMRKAGVFSDASRTTTADVGSNSSGKAPIDTGPRKVAKDKPNPVPSSVGQPKSKATKVVENTNNDDYFDLDDDAFNKLSPPT